MKRRNQIVANLYYLEIRYWKIRLTYSHVRISVNLPLTVPRVLRDCSTLGISRSGLYRPWEFYDLDFSNWYDGNWYKNTNIFVFLLYCIFYLFICITYMYVCILHYIYCNCIRYDCMIIYGIHIYGSF